MSGGALGIVLAISQEYNYLYEQVLKCKVYVSIGNIVILNYILFMMQ